MRPTLKLTALLMLATSLSSAALAQGVPQITEIELGQAGIARYTMQADVTGPQLRFAVPEKAASDVLASLVVYDPAGAVTDLQTDTPGSTPSLFDSVPRTTADLLTALVGETVTLTTANGAFAGQVLGLSSTQVMDDGEALQRATALLLADLGVVEVVLTPGAKVDVPVSAAEGLAKALSAQTSPRDMREFDLTFAAQSDRIVDLSYVTEAAAWKNSWRLLLDEGRLQGWATFENVSGTDWQDVELTLTTGAPLAYSRDLIDPFYQPRPDGPNVAPVPQHNAGIARMIGESENRLRDAVEPEPITLEPTLSGTSQAGQQILSSGILRYALPEAIDLADGRTANRMYLDLPIAPNILGLYRPDTFNAGVILAATLDADQPLAAGLISVQDEAGFVGDAPFNGMQSGDTQLLPFAQATGSKVDRQKDYSGHVVSATFGNGILRLNMRHTMTTTYDTTTLPGTVDQFAVADRESFGKVIEHSGEITRENGAYRVTVPALDGTASIRVVEQATESREVQLNARDLASIAAEIKDNAITLEPELRNAFEQAATLNATAEAAQEEARSLQSGYEGLVAEQKRLRDNLETVSQDALRARYLTALDQTETQIGEYFDRLDQLRQQQEEISAQLLALFANL